MGAGSESWFLTMLLLRAKSLKARWIFTAYFEGHSDLVYIHFLPERGWIFWSPSTFLISKTATFLSAFGHLGWCLFLRGFIYAGSVVHPDTYRWVRLVLMRPLYGEFDHYLCFIVEKTRSQTCLTTLNSHSEKEAKPRHGCFGLLGLNCNRGFSADDQQLLLPFTFALHSYLKIRSHPGIILGKRSLKVFWDQF